MRSRLFFILFVNLCAWTVVLSFYTKMELKNYNVFFKPFGVDLVDINLKVSPSVCSCMMSHEELQGCNRTSLNLVSNTSSEELASLKAMFDNCSAGRLECFRQQTNSSSALQGMLRIKLKLAMKKMCEDQCWKKLAFVTRTCIQTHTRQEVCGLIFCN